MRPVGVTSTAESSTIAAGAILCSIMPDWGTE